MFFRSLLSCAPAARRRNRRFPNTTPRVEILEERLVLYALSGHEWADTNVSFSYVPDGTAMPGGNTSSLMAEMDAVAASEVWQREFARALQTWAEYAPLNFHQVSDDGSPYGTIGYSQGDSRFGDTRLSAMPSAGLAQTSFPSSNTVDSTSAGDIILNTNYTFGIGVDPDFYSVMLHEAGHSLGLDHSVQGTVMYGAYQGILTGLSADDIAGIQAIYGPRQSDAYDAASPNDSLASATPLALSSGALSFQADLTTRSDVDYYRVVAPSDADGTLSVSVDARGLSLLAPQVSVFDQAGNLLGRAAVGTYGYGTVATLNLKGLTAGATYYLAADGATDDVFGVGAYNFDAQFGTGGGHVAPGITVSPTAGLTTSEDGATASFNVVFDSQPAADVTIDLSSSDTSEGTVSVSSVTFTPSNWDTPQTVTVTGVDDSEIDGDVAYTIVTAPAQSSDSNYNGLNAADVSVTNTDNDAPSPALSPDRFEVNDSMAAATDLGTIRSGGSSETALTIDNSSDVDFFRFSPQKSGTYQITAAFAEAGGNLDLRLLDAQGTEIALGNSATDNETLVLSLASGATYYVDVFGVNGAVNDYTLSIIKTGGGGGGGKGNGKGNKLEAPAWLVQEQSPGHESNAATNAGQGGAGQSALSDSSGLLQTGLDLSDRTATSQGPPTSADSPPAAIVASAPPVSLAQTALDEWDARLELQLNWTADNETARAAATAALDEVLGDTTALADLLAGFGATGK